MTDEALSLKIAEFLGIKAISFKIVPNMPLLHKNIGAFGKTEGSCWYYCGENGQTLIPLNMVDDPAMMMALIIHESVRFCLIRHSDGWYVKAASIDNPTPLAGINWNSTQIPDESLGRAVAEAFAKAKGLI